MARILLIVGGGIAAYKAPALVREWIKGGDEVQVVMTEAAHAFTTAMALSTVSQRAVRTALLDPEAEGRVGHIDLADWPEVVVVAPATANRIAGAAHGMASDLASTVLLATQAPVLMAPAMNVNMWRHPATVANLALLAARGVTFVGPDRGDLACGWTGEGRMIDPPVIAEAARTLASRRADWSGRRVLVSAGPTRAYLDPVRFLSNASTGAMGFAIAQAAARRGARVTLVAGPVEQPTPSGVERVDVTTAADMLTTMDAALTQDPHDLVAMVAAVSDLDPPTAAQGKLDKSALLGAVNHGVWTRGVDVLATLVSKHSARAFFLGFGAQTLPGDVTDVSAALAELGRAKLAAKGCDALFVNRVGVADTGFGTATNTGLLIARGERDAVDAGPPVPKAVLADWLLDRALERLADAEEETQP